MIDGMYPAVPPKAGVNRQGRSPTLLTNDKIKILLSTPDTWYVIGKAKKWISGVKHNIESMTQGNISHLADKGKFEIVQRRNKEGTIDIYCRWVSNENII